MRNHGKPKSQETAPVHGEEGIDEAQTAALHTAMASAFKAALEHETAARPVNGVTALSAAFHMAAEVALMVGISREDTSAMVGRIYNRCLRTLRETMPRDQYDALLRKIAQTSLHDGPASAFGKQ
jgi:hypothetical protein